MDGEIGGKTGGGGELSSLLKGPIWMRARAEICLASTTRPSWAEESCRGGVGAGQGPGGMGEGGRVVVGLPAGDIARGGANDLSGGVRNRAGDLAVVKLGVCGHCQDQW